MSVEKRRNFIIQFTYLLIIGSIGFFAAKYVFPLFAPFIMGLIIAIIVRNISDFIIKKTGFRNKIIYLIVLVIFYVLIIALMLMGGTKVVDLIRTFFSRIPQIYTSDIQPAISNILISFTERFPSLKAAADASYQSINQTILNFVEKASNSFLNSITGVAGTVTTLLVSALFTIISSVILTMELRTIETFVKRQMGDRALQIYENVLYTTGNTAFRFIRAYFIIISVTFTELSIGFSILGFANPIVLAALIAVMDALPVIGTGTIMIPWILYVLITGNLKLALGLFILYVVIFVVRQALEPKVVGNQIGLHPILVLMTLYVGARLLGLVGMFLMPLVLVVLKKLNDDKIISILR